MALRCHDCLAVFLFLAGMILADMEYFSTEQEKGSKDLEDEYEDGVEYDIF